MELKKGIYLDKENSRALRGYLHDIGSRESLSREEEKNLVIQSQSGNKEAREKLFLAHSRFVISVAKRYKGLGMEIGDLVNEGNQGFLSALETYDEEKNIRFLCYAVWYIRKSMLEALTKKARMIRLPAYQEQVYQKIRKHMHQLEQEKKSFVHPEEVESEFGIPFETTARILETTPPPSHWMLLGTNRGETPIICRIKFQMKPMRLIEKCQIKKSVNKWNKFSMICVIRL